MPITFHEKNQIFHLQGGDVSYVLYISPTNSLINLYWGKTIPADVLEPNLWAYQSAASFDSRKNRRPYELPANGTGWYGTPAVTVRNAQGNNIVVLKYESHTIYPGKKPLEGLPATYVEDESEADSLEITLRDKLTGLSVTLVYSIYTATGALTRSLRITNHGDKPLILSDAMSASVPLQGKEYDLIHLKGVHIRERMLVRTPVGQAEYRIFSQRGASGHEENPFMALCTPGATEHLGEVWAVNLVYSGSFQAMAYVDSNDNTRLSIGLNSDVFSWNLDPEETFVTPEAVMVYSDAGLNGMSHVYHKLYRERLVRGKWRDKERPILINTWEAVHFDFNEQKLLDMADVAKDLGIELFVLDDGWFGKRDDDTTSLGDWFVDQRKFPEGLEAFVSKIKARGLMFGIWFEPEMISPDSDLYRAHSDWCLHAEGRDRTTARNQLILDLSRKDVQDYIIQVVGDVLRSAPIDYVKWDMNRNMIEAASSELEPRRQLETQHRYMLGVYRVMEELTSAFPDILFESCSGGGGRFDPGMLYYMPQTWTSDNTDAIARLYIQYGTSLAYPAVTMGAHVSSCASVGFPMRGHVAMSGNFGYEMDLTQISDEEKEAIRSQVKAVKQLRHLTQNGIFTRLLSPFDGGTVAWQFVSEAQDEALLFVYNTLSLDNPPTLRVKMCGLDPNSTYADEEGNLHNGAILMRMGMWIDLRARLISKMVYLRRVGNL